MNSIIEEYNRLQARMEELAHEFVEKNRDFLKHSFDVLQREAPEISAVSWTQGTPGFNDGEPCTFSIHEPEFYLDDEVQEEGYIYTPQDLERARERYEISLEYSQDPEEWKRKFIEEYEARTGRRCYTRNPSPYPSDPEQAKAEIEAIEAFFERYSPERCDAITKAFDNWCSVFWSVPEDIMRQLYGDGSKVKISASGVEVEEWYNY